MVCGDINYTIDSNGVNCVTVELSDGQIATLGSYVRESRAPDIPENTWKLRGKSPIFLRKIPGKYTE